MGLGSMLTMAGQPWELEAGELLWLPHGVVGLDCPHTEEAWRHYCVYAKHMESYMWDSSPVWSMLWDYRQRTKIGWMT